MPCASLLNVWAGSTLVLQSDNRVVLQSLHGVVVVPLPDPLGQDFLSELNAQLLQYLHQHSVKGVVLDMSGVALLDGADFQNLHRIWQTSTLMGSRLVLAGLQPGVAATLTMLNVDDSWTTPALSVEHAMEKLR